MKRLIKNTTLALAASLTALSAVPAGAADFKAPGFHAAPSEDGWNKHRNRGRQNQRYYSQQAYYGEPVYRDTRVWRGDDGRTYCRKKDGTTGLIIGGAAGALLGREIDGGRDRTVGTILGAAAGALLGREVDGHGVSCR
jgi:hypothetical protein